MITINDDTDLAAISQRENLSELSDDPLKASGDSSAGCWKNSRTQTSGRSSSTWHFRAGVEEFDADFVKGIRKFKSGGGR